MNFFGIGLPEMLVIFTVALLIFGPRKLPEISRSVAKTIKSLQQASRDFEMEMKRELEATETRGTAPPPAPISTVALTVEETLPTTEVTPTEPVPGQPESIVS